MTTALVVSSSDRKISIVAWLIGLHSIIYLFDGIAGIAGGASYGEYGNSFIMFTINAVLCYVLQKRKSKAAHRLALLVTGLPIVRFVLAAAVILMAPTPSASAGILVTGGVFALAFGIVPFGLLLQRDVRSQYAR